MLEPTTSECDSSPPLAILEKISLYKNGQVILDKVSLEVMPRTVISLIGPNGAGKSSLIRIILGLERPSSGKIHRELGLKLAYLPQNGLYNTLIPLTVENFLHLHPQGRLAGSVQRACTQVGLKPRHLSQRVNQLSGGERQRLFLARALLNKPKLMILDEPSCSLDAQGQSELYQVLLKVRQELQCAVLLVSHDMHLVLANTDQVICLNKRIACYGTPEHLEQQAGLAEFLDQSQLKQPYLAAYRHRHCIK